LHVTIEETDEGTQICLHLAPSETLPDPESFVRLLRPSLAVAPGVPSRPQPTGLRLVPPVPLEDLPVAGISRLRLLGEPEDIRLRAVRDAFLDDLEDALTKQKRFVGGFVGTLSKAVAPILPFEGESISQQLALAGGISNTEVHIRMTVPFLGMPVLGRQISLTVARDFQRDALKGSVANLEAALVQIATLQETVREGLKVARNPVLSSFQPSVTRQGVVELKRADANLKRLETAAQTSLKKAKRVRRGG